MNFKNLHPEKRNTPFRGIQIEFSLFLYSAVIFLTLNTPGYSHNSTKKTINTIVRVSIEKTTDHTTGFEQPIFSEDNFCLETYIETKHELWINRKNLNDNPDDIYNVSLYLANGDKPSKNTRKFVRFVNESQSPKKPGLFIDSLDHAIDLSKWLLDVHGFIPVISPITEPAVGYGAALAGMFFIPKKKTDAQKFQMPDIVGAAGGLTGNGTWFGGAGYIGFWKKDQIRYRGIVGYGDIKLKYYGTGVNSFSENSTDFNIGSYFFLLQAIFRMGESSFFLGGKYQLGKATITAFDEGIIPDRDIELINSGIGLIAEFENFNNVLSPTSGLRVNLTYDQFLQGLGSDRDFGRFTFFTHYYIPVNKFWDSGFRIESQLATGDPPFYMLPFLNLRGIPVMRYQGELTALVETEQLFMLTKRWGVVGFAGYGKAFRSLDELSEGSSAWNVGTGFRYLIARLLGLKMGMDIARGPEDWAIYVVVGSSWLK